MKKKNLLSIGIILIALILSSCNSKKLKSNDLEIDKLNGKVKKVIIKHSEDITKQEIFVYNIEGYIISSERSFEGEYEDENGTPSGDYGAPISYGLMEEKTEYLRDSKSNVIEKNFYSKSPVENYKLIEKNKYKYDENGNIVSQIDIFQNQETLETYKNKYDKNNNLIECLNVTTNSKKTFKYDDNNNIVEFVNEKAKTTYKYDNNNNLIHEDGYNINSGGSKELTYDDDNNLIEEINYSSQNKIENVIKHSYSDSQLKEDKYYGSDGDLYSTTTYKEYDSQGNWIKKVESSSDGMIYNTERIIEYYSDNEKSSAEINNYIIEEKIQPVKTEEKVYENDNLKTFNEIQLTLMDASLKKAKIFLGEPDIYEYAFGHISKGFAVYYNRVANQNDSPKHLVLFLRMNGNQWGDDAMLEEIYEVDDYEKACFGIHCIEIKNRTIYTNALGLIDKGYNSLN